MFDSQDLHIDRWILDIIKYDLHKLEEENLRSAYKQFSLHYILSGLDYVW